MRSKVEKHEGKRSPERSKCRWEGSVTVDLNPQCASCEMYEKYTANARISQDYDS
jgi:hypothetical protein